ncbi:MAG TPA: dihydrolipoamide acetyltransferase family protein [Vicinamibacterales bacterium]|nr:dihydrolipoamide acetyltransferase family protein [Vicinamibacterales bacterium]
MATNVVMPQMGESIAEGTIVRWIKKVGDSIDRDEPLFEISTDKVDAEIPSPAAGVLTDIKVKEGETVPVNSVVAVIGTAGEAVVKDGATSDATAQGGGMPEAAVGQPETSAPSTGSDPAARSGTEDARRSDAAAPAETSEPSPPSGPLSREELRRQKSSPLVRRIAKEHDVDIQQVQGTGISGRVTKNDILGFIDSGGSKGAQARDGAAPQATPGRTPAAAGPVYKPGENVQIVPMSVMRRKIAEHMVLSAHTSPHVYSVYEVNFGRVSALRDKRKADYEAAGARLTFTGFIAKAIVDALREFPVVNASVDGQNIVYKKDINLGIAVALENGLIVPVIRKADEKNLLGLSRAINDLAVRARSKKLSPDEVQGGTFTITNPGIFGALYGLPLINQPQVAILGVGTIEKRAVVIDDAIAIRPMCNLSLGYDHRLIDGAEAGKFLAYVKERLENFEEGWL